MTSSLSNIFIVISDIGAVGVVVAVVVVAVVFDIVVAVVGCVVGEWLITPSIITNRSSINVFS